METKYMKACNKAEQNKKLNPNMVNFDCETMIYNLNHGEADSKDIRFYTKWYEDSLKNGFLDWDTLNEYFKKKKKIKKKKTKKNTRKKNIVKKRSKNLRKKYGGSYMIRDELFHHPTADDLRRGAFHQPSMLGFSRMDNSFENRPLHTPPQEDKLKKFLKSIFPGDLAIKYYTEIAMQPLNFTIWRELNEFKIKDHPERFHELRDTNIRDEDKEKIITLAEKYNTEKSLPAPAPIPSPSPSPAPAPAPAWARQLVGWLVKPELGADGAQPQGESIPKDDNFNKRNVYINDLISHRKRFPAEKKSSEQVSSAPKSNPKYIFLIDCHFTRVPDLDSILKRYNISKLAYFVEHYVGGDIEPASKVWQKARNINSKGSGPMEINIIKIPLPKYKKYSNGLEADKQYTLSFSQSMSSNNYFNDYDAIIIDTGHSYPIAVKALNLKYQGKINSEIIDLIPTQKGDEDEGNKLRMKRQRIFKEVVEVPTPENVEKITKYIDSIKISYDDDFSRFSYSGFSMGGALKFSRKKSKRSKIKKRKKTQKKY